MATSTLSLFDRPGTAHDWREIRARTAAASREWNNMAPATKEVLRQRVLSELAETPSRSELEALCLRKLAEAHRARSQAEAG